MERISRAHLRFVLAGVSLFAGGALLTKTIEETSRQNIAHQQELLKPQPRPLNPLELPTNFEVRSSTGFVQLFDAVFARFIEAGLARHITDRVNPDDSPRLFYQQGNYVEFRTQDPIPTTYYLWRGFTPGNAFRSLTIKTEVKPGATRIERFLFSDNSQHGQSFGSSLFDIGIHPIEELQEGGQLLRDGYSKYAERNNRLLSETYSQSLKAIQKQGRVPGESRIL